MTPDIQELDARTVDRIAAGEVVERPASAVKELVENSIDADASRVEVAVEAGGTERIEVRDDGMGMTEEEVRLAVREHTTSKIESIDDLEAGVATLGFRGEALHAVGAVSRMTVRTKPRGGGRGTELVVEGGEVTSVEPTGCPEGTTVVVEDLFYNVPARRKYLKTEATEFSHVNSVVTGYALANPDVAVALSHDGRETFATGGQGDLRSTVMAVYGREVASAMIPVEAGVDRADATDGGDADGTANADRGDDLPDGPLEGVSGLVSHPETTRASREYLTTFVNGRYVRAGAVREAVVDAYGAQLAADRYPFAVLFLDLPGDTVDVNVHPRKMEIRYSKPEEVKRQVRTAVEDALREEGLLRSSAPRGKSQAEQTEISPERTVKSTDTLDSIDDTSTSSVQDSATGDTSAKTDSTHEAGTADTGETATDDVDTQTTLSGDDAHTSTEYDNFPDLRVLGQLHDTYIVAEADDGLILIDQHTADERINYERLKEQFEGDTTTQALAEPVQLELTAGEAALFDSYEDALARLGFHANRVDDRTVKVTTAPALVAESAGPSVIRDVLADLVTGKEAAEQTVEAVADELLSDMACYPSITGNTSLTDGSVVNLLSTLDDCENPWACPHGRPVLIHIDSDEIDDRFERDYPGH